MGIAKRPLCFATILLPITALADDLPTELLLRCDLKQTVFMNNGGKPDLFEDKLSKDFRLKNGVFGWTDLSIPIGENCKLEDGEIFCRWSGVVPPQKGSPLGARTEKRQSSVRLSRATGQIRVELDTWGYKGDGVKGTPDSSKKMVQSGVCRTIGKALF
jgi:hypothetical protein